jgi:hypothetical protein
MFLRISILVFPTDRMPVGSLDDFAMTKRVTMSHTVARRQIVELLTCHSEILLHFRYTKLAIHYLSLYLFPNKSLVFSNFQLATLTGFEPVYRPVRAIEGLPTRRLIERWAASRAAVTAASRRSLCRDESTALQSYTGYILDSSLVTARSFSQIPGLSSA